MIRKLILFFSGLFHGKRGEQARLRRIILEASRECDLLVARSRQLRDRKPR